MSLDVEYAVRQHLRDLDLAGVVGREVHFGIPDAVPSAFVTLERVGGGFVSGTAPLESVRLGLAAWGASKKEAGDIARALSDLFFTIEEEDIGNGVHVGGATVDLVLWRPSPETGRARYIVDVSVIARPSI